MIDDENAKLTANDKLLADEVEAVESCTTEIEETECLIRALELEME